VILTRAVAIVILLSLAVTARSSEETFSGTTGAPETVTIEDLDTATRPAAQALLDSPFLKATMAYFDLDNPEHIYRFDWIGARANGEQVVVAREVDSDALVAFVQTGGVRFSASAIGEENQPCSRFGPALDPPEGALGLYLATQMAEGTSLVVATESAAADSTVTRQAAANGSTVWRLTRSSTEDQFGVPDDAIGLEE
jgi:hypothetical protein